MLVKVRDVAPEEGLRCECGSGECHMLAVEVQDGGGEGTIALCEQHAAEFRAFAVLVAEMTPDQFNKLESAVSAAEETP
jgi:hypothetical protein